MALVFLGVSAVGVLLCVHWHGVVGIVKHLLKFCTGSRLFEDDITFIKDEVRFMAGNIYSFINLNIFLPVPLYFIILEIIPGGGRHIKFLIIYGPVFTREFIEAAVKNVCA